MLHESVVRQHAERRQSDGHAITGLVTQSIGFRLGPRHDNRNSGHPLRGVNGDLIERGFIFRLLPMRQIQTHSQSLISSNKIYFLDYSVRQPATTFGEVGVLADTNILGTKYEFNRLTF